MVIKKMVKYLFATEKDFNRYIEDLMGEGGNTEEANLLSNLLIEKGFFRLEWNGFWSTKKWDSDDFDFNDLWLEATK